MESKHLNNQLQTYKLYKLYNSNKIIIGYRVESCNNIYNISTSDIFNILKSNNAAVRLNYIYNEANIMLSKLKLLNSSMDEMEATRTLSPEINKIKPAELEDISYNYFNDIAGKVLKPQLRLNKGTDYTVYNNNRILTFDLLFGNYAGSKVDISNISLDSITSMRSTFAFNSYVDTLIVGKHNTSKLWTMEHFAYSSDIVKLDLTGMNTSHVTVMKGIAGDMQYLRECLIGDTSAVKDFSSAFYHTINLRKLAPLDLTSATDITSMFERTSLREISFLPCKANSLHSMTSFIRNSYVEDLDMSGVEATITDMSWAFSSCISLRTIDIRKIHITHDVVLRQVFDNSYRIDKIIMNTESRDILFDIIERVQDCRKLTGKTVREIENLVVEA